VAVTLGEVKAEVGKGVREAVRRGEMKEKLEEFGRVLNF
jgi:hypothetical protein